MLNLILVGPPGAGKGTQSEKILVKYNLKHISTGDLLRAERNAGTELGNQANEFISKGELVPDAVVIGMVKNFMADNTDAKGFIFDGFPRTIAQAEALDTMLSDFNTEISIVLGLEVNEDELVNHLTIAQTLNNNNINKLIELDNVQFTDASLNQNYFDQDVFTIGGGTNHNVVDAAGNTLIVRVSEYATFASAAIPSGNGKLRGVLTKFGSTFQFMIRSLNDVKLNGPRVLPLFEETFTSNFPNWTKFSVIGTQVWSLDSSGNPGNCANMNGFSSGAQNNEDWLISPSINLTGVGSANLTFQTVRPFSGTALAVLVSTNYSGSGSPTAATWTTLSGFNLATSGTTWRDSGNVSLAAFIGQPNVRIAFKYVSTTAGASQWKVDNVKVQ